MAIVGALNDGLNGDPTMLIAKAILDGVASILFAASLGKGVYLSIVLSGLRRREVKENSHGRK